jgi:hypothetical protein
LLDDIHILDLTGFMDNVAVGTSIPIMQDISKTGMDVAIILLMGSRLRVVAVSKSEDDGKYSERRSDRND